MGVFELVIILVLFAYHIGILLKIKKPIWLFVPGFVLIMTIFHFFLEGYRWQMLPVYFLTLILFLISLRKAIAYLKRPEAPLFIRFNWLGWVLGALALSTGILLCTFFRF